MTAAEARVKAHNVKLEAYKDQYEQIKKHISSAASAGRFEVTYYDPLTTNVRQQLTGEGYTLKEEITRLKDPGVRISW
jgi:predicted  nucleic acid-binding Zn-ribbon protein